MTFVNQLGDTVELNSLRNRIVVINFFFTRCPSVCPGLAVKIKKLQESFSGSKNDSIVQFISVSVDPEYDSVPQLRKFADRFTSNHDNWWFVTGNKKAIYDFGMKELKASIAGWYNGFDDAKQAKLVKDIPLLMLEKQRKRSFKTFLKELFGRS